MDEMEVFFQETVEHFHVSFFGEMKVVCQVL